MSADGAVDIKPGSGTVDLSKAALVPLDRMVHRHGAHLDRALPAQDAYRLMADIGWHRINVAAFRGELGHTPPEFEIVPWNPEAPNFGGCYKWTNGRGPGTIRLSEAAFVPEEWTAEGMLAMYERLSSLLLHEMVHQYVVEGRKIYFAGHGPIFQEEWDRVVSNLREVAESGSRD